MCVWHAETRHAAAPVLGLDTSPWFLLESGVESSPLWGLTNLSEVADSPEHLELSLRNAGHSPLRAWSERLCKVDIFHPCLEK